MSYGTVLPATVAASNNVDDSSERTYVQLQAFTSDNDLLSVENRTVTMTCEQKKKMYDTTEIRFGFCFEANFNSI